MFSLDSRALHGMMEIVATQTEEANVRIGADGSMRMKACALDRVTLVEVTAEPGFVTGDWPEEPFGADLNSWMAALSPDAPGHEASIKWVDGAFRVTRGMFTAMLREPMVADTLDIPSPEMSARVVLGARLLTALARATVKSPTDPWRFSLSDEGMSVSVEDGKGEGVMLTVPPESLKEMVLDDGPVKSVYPAEAWRKIVRAVPPDAGMAIEMDSDYPCRVTVEGAGWKAVWMCAPRIEQEDDSE